MAPERPEPIQPVFKVRKEVRDYLHAKDFHDLCRISFEREITGYDFSPQYLPGRTEAVTNPVTGEQTIARQMIDVTTAGGEPIYSGKIIEVHW